MSGIDQDGGRMSVLQGKNDLTTKITSTEWINSDGRLIVDTFNGIIQPEVDLLHLRPNLWSLSENSVIDLPGFDNDTAVIAQKEWQELYKRYRGTNRQVEISASSKDNPSTFLIFETNLGLLKQGFWNCPTIWLDDNHVPIELSKDISGIKINSGQEIFSEDVQKLAEYLLIMKSRNNDEIGDKKAERDVQSMKKSAETGELMTINLLMNTPKNFSQFYEKEKMEITSPDRLMTDKEMEQWQVMVNEVIKAKSEGITVGNQRFEGIFQFGLGLALKLTDLNEEEKSLGIYTLHMPTAIRANGLKQGWLICQAKYFPSSGNIKVSYGHGNEDIYIYKNLK